MAQPSVVQLKQYTWTLNVLSYALVCNCSVTVLEDIQSLRPCFKEVVSTRPRFMVISSLYFRPTYSSFVALRKRSPHIHVKLRFEVRHLQFAVQTLFDLDWSKL